MWRLIGNQSSHSLQDALLEWIRLKSSRAQGPVEITFEYKSVLNISQPQAQRGLKSGYQLLSRLPKRGWQLKLHCCWSDSIITRNAHTYYVSSSVTRGRWQRNFNLPRTFNLWTYSSTLIDVAPCITTRETWSTLTPPAISFVIGILPFFKPDASFG